MNNPESVELSPRTIYSYNKHQNLPWNMTQYQVPTLHYDYKQIMKDRMYASQKKGVKVNDFYVTKRGFYMDYDLKVSKGVPASSLHGKQEPWPHHKSVLEGDALKTARQSKKSTYLEKMELQQTRRPVPGISTYKLQKSPEEHIEVLKHSHRQKSHGQKRYYHEDTEFLGDKVPGPGNYNPHDSVEKLKKTKGDWIYWTKKHEKWDKTVSKRQAKVPAPGTYTPIYRSYNSFEGVMKKQEKEKKIKNGFGSDARFPYLRPNKKMIVEKRPAPSAYETKIDWKGKSVSPKKKEWIKMIWKGSPEKVYQ